MEMIDLVRSTSSAPCAWMIGQSNGARCRERSIKTREAAGAIEEQFHLLWPPALAVLLRCLEQPALRHEYRRAGDSLPAIDDGALPASVK